MRFGQMTRAWRRAAMVSCLLITALALAAGCSDRRRRRFASIGGIDTSVPVTLQVISGNEQTVTAGASLQPLVVRATDAGGSFVAGVPVVFSVVSGDARAELSNVATDGDGLAAGIFTAGSTPGRVTIAAAAPDGATATFGVTVIAPTSEAPPAATGGPGGPGGTDGTVASADFTGSGQTGTAGAPLGSPFVVTLLDSSGEPVAGVPVTFIVTSGGGALSTTTATTDENGQAQTTLTLGTAAGTNTVTATAPGLENPVVFTATGTAGPAAAIASTSGSGQTGSTGSTLAQPFSLVVVDALGNPVAGETVTFAIASGGGSLSAMIVTTDASGRAESTLTLGPNAGGTVVTATPASLPGTSATFTATATSPSGVPANMTASSTDLGSGTVGTTLPPLSVQVTDSAGNPIAGVTVVFTVTQGNGTLSSESATTDANGIATTTLTLGTTAGTNTVTATANGPDGQPIGGSPVTFTATGTAGSPAALAFRVQPVRATQNLPFSPAVEVAIVDAHGNTVTTSTDTISIALGANPGSGTLSGTTAQVTANGVATFFDLAIDRPALGYTLVATSTALGSVASAPFEVAAPPVLLAVAAMGVARTELAAVLGLDGFIYALGGRATDGTALATVERYDATTNAWTAVTSMPSPRYGFGAVMLPDGRLLVIGGYAADGTPLGSVIALDLETLTWSDVTTLPQARGGLAAVLGPDDRVYVLGGEDARGQPTNTVQIYDPATGQWTSGAKLPHAGAGITATLGRDGRIYAMGGTADGNMGPVVWAYDAAANDWTHAATQPKAEPGTAAATGPDGRIYALGPYDRAAVTFESFSAKANQTAYAPVVGLQTFRSSLAAVVGPDGRIYAIGGSRDGEALALVEAYGPKVHVTPTAGPPGTVVTIDGANFAANASVEVFWGSTLLATGTTDSAGRLAAPISATIPASPGTGLVVRDTVSGYPVFVAFTVQ